MTGITIAVRVYGDNILFFLSTDVEFWKGWYAGARESLLHMYNSTN